MTRAGVRLLLLRAACRPLPEYPPRPRLLWRPWVWLMERRYREAERQWGRERARRFDYIPF